MEYDLLVVGNGFDLGCNFRTSYSDFLKYAQDKMSSNPLVLFFNSARYQNLFENDEWNSFELLLCQLLQFLNYLFTSDNVECYFSELEDGYGFEPIRRYFYLTIKDLSKMPENMALIMSVYSPLERKLKMYSDKDYKVGIDYIDDVSNITSLYFRIWVCLPKNKATKKDVLNILIAELESQLGHLEKGLLDYIKQETDKTTDGPVAFIQNSAKLVVSFNYSKTAQKLYNLNDDCVAYIHGSTDSSAVIGVEPSMITNQTFNENSIFIKFFKRFRRIFKDCNKDYNKKIMNLINENSVIAIYGHSLDLSDVSILKPLFEKKAKRYDIYCYKEKELYKLKLSRLIGLDLYNELNDDSKINMIVVN